MPTGIRNEFLQLARDEGSGTALNVLEDIQDSLETLSEIGDYEERMMARVLLRKVNYTIQEILACTLTEEQVRHGWLMH